MLERRGRRVGPAGRTAAPSATRPCGGSVEHIAVDPDGSRVITGADDGTIRRWNLLSGRCECVIAAAPQEPILAMALSPSGRLAAVGTRLATAVWDVESGDRLVVLDLPWVLRLQFLADERLVAATATGDIAEWEVAAGRLGLAMK
jgi:WD40 repeat protein